MPLQMQMQIWIPPYRWAVFFFFFLAGALVGRLVGRLVRPVGRRVGESVLGALVCWLRINEKGELMLER